MANVPRKASNNIYKKGKLSKNARFSTKRIKWTPIIVIICVLATFIFAMILGNILGDKAGESSGATTSQGGATNPTPPDAEKVDPRKELNAYFADLQHASPDTNISLSIITEAPRYRGNALFIDMKNDKNEVIYFSEKLDELGIAHQSNLDIQRLKNHLEYYDEFAVGLFESDFSAKLDAEQALKLQTNEILLLKEATDTAFGQIIIEFSENITKSSLIYYQTYLLNLKLACPDTPVGIKLPQRFLENPDNAGMVADLLDVTDFFALDLSDQGAEEMKNVLTNIIYLTERYNCLMMISDSDELTLSQKLAVLSDKGIDNYIIK